MRFFTLLSLVHAVVAAPLIASHGAHESESTDVDHPPQIGNSREMDLIVEDAATRKCPKGIVVNISNDTRASFSHYGVAADVFALGTGIKSTWIKGGVKVESGTSMATSHVTGLAAYLLGLKDIKAPELCNLVASMSLKDVIKGIPKNTVNLLIQNGRRSEVSAPINTRS
ncbi:putative endopeptidase K [Fusarium bulbicola]|nr:putative endopeptidase K [Fusarium bulbicola]